MVCKKCKSEKYQKQIQHPVTDLKIELLVKIVNKFKLYTIFATGSEFSSDCNKSNVSYEQQKSYIMVFWNGGSYYPANILLVQIQQQKH